ncbi:MAG: hypothetical protein H0U49_02400, partial [Parachlamydiaceae bacterium]|nr:hypothetical protein [Parachlamydiaceae bacterium]
MLGLIELIKMGVVTDPFIEQIVTDSNILFWNTKNTEFFNALSQSWTPTGDLLTLTQLCGDLRLGVFIKGILNTTTLNETARLYSHLRDFSGMNGLHKLIKKRLLCHVLQMKAKCNSTIWIAMTKQVFGQDELLQMKELGFDPHWIDPENGQTFLFTKSAWMLKYDKGKNDIGFDLNHIDKHGDNALE